MDSKRVSQAVTALPCTPFETPASPTPRPHLATTKVLCERSTSSGRHSVTVAVALPLSCYSFNDTMRTCISHSIVRLSPVRLVLPFHHRLLRTKLPSPPPSTLPSIAIFCFCQRFTHIWVSLVFWAQGKDSREGQRAPRGESGWHTLLSLLSLDRQLGDCAASIPLKHLHTRTHIFIEPFSLSGA